MAILANYQFPQLPTTPLPSRLQAAIDRLAATRAGAGQLPPLPTVQAPGADRLPTNFSGMSGTDLAGYDPEDPRFAAAGPAPLPPLPITINGANPLPPMPRRSAAGGAGRPAPQGFNTTGMPVTANATASMSDPATQNGPSAFDKFRGSSSGQLVGDALTSFGLGLMQGDDWQEGLAIGGQNLAGMQPGRRAERKAADDKATTETKRAGMVEWLKTNGPKYAGAVEAGLLEPGQAYEQMLADARVDTGDQFTLGEGDVRYNPDGSIVAQGPAARRQPLQANERAEIFQLEDAISGSDLVLSGLNRALELNDDAWDGAFAKERATAQSFIPDWMPGVGGNKAQEEATLELQNVTTELALTQLKTIFGASPTEGERAILTELQGSVGMPRDTRARIYNRAKELAELRVANNRRRADDIRSGAIYEPGYGAAPPAVGSTPAPAGVPQDVWDAMSPEDRALWQ